MADLRHVAILIFDDVEVLDFCGPFEVFSVTARLHDPTPFDVFVLAESLRPVTARNGLSVNPRYDISNCPRPDILVIPGGYGTRREMHNEVLIDWIKSCEPECELVLSVCTGAILLAKAGMLEGLRAVTHHSAFDLLQEVAPNTEVVKNQRFVDNGRIILSGGISTGIDMSLHVVARLLGNDVALATARHMEYEWSPGES